MTKDEALKLALNALENNRQTHHYCEDTWYSCPKHKDGCANESEGNECNCGADEANAEIDKAITDIKEALAQPEQDSTYTYASSLATAIWQKHYIKESPKFALLDTIEGVLTQIDNMTCGLVREKPAQPEQEPVAYDKTEMNCFVQDLYDKKMQEGKHGHYETMFHVVHQAIKKAPPQRTWVGLSEQEHTELAIECGCLSSDWVFYGAALERKIKEKNEI